MLQTVEATIDENGEVRLTEKVAISGRHRALVTILDAVEDVNEAFILAESALAEGWLGPEADEAWKHLADLPAIDEGNP